MRGVWRVADVRAAEERLMATLPPLTLMRRAAEGLARRCAQLLGDSGGVYGRRVALLVGAGNNGGDALFAGALLARRGAAVRALLLAPERTHADGLAELRRSGGGVLAVSATPAPDALREFAPDLVIDGIVGIGGRGGLRGPAAEAVAALDALRPRPLVVAVDVPSGVDVDTGAVDGPAVRADVTVTFGCLKPALAVGPAVPLAGLVDLVDIGLSDPEGEPAAWLPDREDIAAWWPEPGPSSDKYSRGVAGLATGSAGFPGAALLSVAGALAGPAGMVRYAGPVAVDVVRAHPSVVISDSVASAGRVQAWLVGSGIGTDDRAVAELKAVLAAPVPVVVDADAITLAGDPAVTDLLRKRPAPTVVTPHDREYVRLAGQPVGPDRLAAARELAERLGVVVLLKGYRTVVAHPDGGAWVNPTGTPMLATAGTGDVLAGLLVSLLAGGVPAERAALAAAYVHGLAARLAASPIRTDDDSLDGVTSSRPITAQDVARALPIVIGSLAEPY
ncbi:MAG: NAD(P)H-hydrate dehydratase [Micromonosporaceae bacterium]|nr:NAD(P)H-hydrate dehydratase [Micromonosporaceae bacterium]